MIENIYANIFGILIAAFLLYCLDSKLGYFKKFYEQLKNDVNQLKEDYTK